MLPIGRTDFPIDNQADFTDSLRYSQEAELKIAASNLRLETKDIPPLPAAVVNRLAGSGTRSSKNWRSLPGSFDDVNAHLLFSASGDGNGEGGLAENPYGIPTIKRETNLPLPEQLVGYGSVRLRNPAIAGAFALHCFVDDYRLARLWNRPYKTVAGLLNRGYGCIFTPDFSLYRDWPLALQIWNTYRNRWLGAFWQKQGLKVVPTISWADKASFEFCFAGIEPGSQVALSTIGTNNPANQSFFEIGFYELLERATPTRILCYGGLSQGLIVHASKRGTEVVQYSTSWEEKRRQMRASKANLRNEVEEKVAPLSSESLLIPASIALQSSRTRLPLNEQHTLPLCPGPCQSLFDNVASDTNLSGGM